LKTYVATKNTGKLHEMRAIFEKSPLALDVYPDYGDVEEVAPNYAANALLKAMALHEQLKAAHISAAVLSDDSGIEVDALDGRPGIFSARYWGEVSWPERRAKLLEELKGVPQDRRGAKFVCAMALILPDGRQVEGYGEVRGQIVLQEAGTSGFGYDPIFFYPAAGKTFAELSEEQKNRVSHRYHAADALLRALSHLE